MTSEHLTEESNAPGKRGKALLVVMAATVVMLLAMAGGPASSASADPYCKNVWLGPNHQCHLPAGLAGDLTILSAYSPERAVCTALLGYYGEQLDSWVCAKAGTYPWYFVAESRPFGYYRAAIKNNNMNNPGDFTGFYYCCQP